MAPRTILLVDQDGDSLAIYSLILEHHGYRVLRARTSAEGLRLALEQHPDLVVSELCLDLVDGTALPDRIRQEPWVPHLPIVVLTTLPFPRERSAACDSYLAKPCVPSRLLAEVDRFLS